MNHSPPLTKLEKELLLSKRSYIEYSAREWQEYVRSLYKVPEVKKKAGDVSFRINEKGTFIFTIRNRDPKYILPAELDSLAKEHSLSSVDVWREAGKKKHFTIKRD